MNEEELKDIVRRFIEKGYADHEQLRYSDDLYNASDEDRDKACDFLDEALSVGLDQF